ncbi:Uncharacterised protein [Klebsiella pneumoniae]|nr:Uncharacterised protein [Klebsiella pneumoniae]
MNKIATVTTLLAALAGATGANAAQTKAPVDYQYQTKDISGLHTFTLGYAQSHIQHFNNIKGLNLNIATKSLSCRLARWCHSPG